MIRILLLFIVLAFVLQGCAPISITRSNYRNPMPDSIRLSPDVTLTPTGEVHIFVAGLVNTDFYPSSFRIDASGKVIYIDPVEVDGQAFADYIFITHAHGDHLSLPDIKKLSKNNTLIICPEMAADRLSDYKIRVIKPGDIIDFGDIKCEAVAAYNINSGLFGLTAHPRTDKNVGYILTISGIRIYHAGDTDLIPEMKGIKNITAALVPIGGGNLTTGPAEAAEAINIIKPLIAIPMHYVPGTNQAETFKKLVDTGIQVRIMK